MHTVAPAPMGREMNACTALFAAAAICGPAPSKSTPSTRSKASKRCEVCKGTGIRRESDRDCAACGGLGTAPPDDMAPEQNRDACAATARGETDVEREARWLALSFAAQLTDEELARYSDDDPEIAAQHPLTHAAVRMEIERRAQREADPNAAAATGRALGTEPEDYVDPVPFCERALERIEERHGRTVAVRCLFEAMREVVRTMGTEIADRVKLHGWIGVGVDFCARFDDGRALDLYDVIALHEYLAALEQAKGDPLGKAIIEAIHTSDWGALETITRHLDPGHPRLGSHPAPPGYHHLYDHDLRVLRYELERIEEDRS